MCVMILNVSISPRLRLVVSRSDDWLLCPSLNRLSFLSTLKGQPDERRYLSGSLARTNLQECLREVCLVALP